MACTASEERFLIFVVYIYVTQVMIKFLFGHVYMCTVMWTEGPFFVEKIPVWCVRTTEKISIYFTLLQAPTLC